jgi:hypothetical protein
MEFHFDPREHSLQVSAKAVEGSGCGVEWINKFYKYCISGSTKYRKPKTVLR